ncbi:MAG: LysR family transcriptional regulator [Caldilineaceae bacterium]
MELSQLRALVTIQHEGTFTLAAERLHLSQPALSQQIKALEQEVGAPIFERRGRRNTLTAVGEIVLARATQILQQLDQLQVDIGELLALRQGQVRIGTSDTICLYLLPEVIQRFRARHPQIEIHLTNRPSQEVVTLLQAGAIDFGIVTLPVQGQGVETTYLCDRQDVAVCAPEHRLARESRSPRELSVTALAAEQLLLLEQGTTSRAFLDQLFVQAGVAPQTMALGSIEVLKRYAELNLGIAVVPLMAVQAEIATRRLHMFTLPWAPPRAIGLVSRRNSYQTPAAHAFIGLLNALFPLPT